MSYTTKDLYEEYEKVRGKEQKVFDVYIDTMAQLIKETQDESHKKTLKSIVITMLDARIKDMKKRIICGK